jgi:hypothetical protein
MKSFNVADAITTTFDPVLYIKTINKKLNISTDMFICEKIPTCSCNSDECIKVTSATCILGFNDRCVLTISLVSDAKFKGSQVIRLFSLNKKTNKKMHIIDIDKFDVRFKVGSGVGFTNKNKITIKNNHITVPFDYNSFNLDG